MLSPVIVRKPAFVVVGLEAPFIHALSPDANNFEVIGPLWNRFLQVAGHVSNRVGGEMFGIIYGWPEAERSHPDELQYVAGVAVNSAEEIPQDMMACAVSGGEFAVFTHCGPIATLGRTIDEIYRVWLPASDYAHAETADVELYDSRFQVNLCQFKKTATRSFVSVTAMS